MKNRLWPYIMLLVTILLLEYAIFTKQLIGVIVFIAILIMAAESLASICSMRYSECSMSKSSKIANEILAYLFMTLGYISPFIIAGLLFYQYFML